MALIFHILQQFLRFFLKKSFIFLFIWNFHLCLFQMFFLIEMFNKILNNFSKWLEWIWTYWKSKNCTFLGRTMQVVSPFRRCLPQFLAVNIKNTLLLVYGLTMGMPTILIPNLNGSNSKEVIVMNQDGISWLGKYIQQNSK